jgi:beta-fructofuranosidase
VTDDPTFPSLHGRPRRGWLNDPNGLCRIGGRYHVFFQFNPDAPVHERIAWGHVSSDDLLHWAEEPVALVPRPGEVDAYGCWSGCLVDDGGVPTAVYTAVRAEPTDAWATLARGSTDLRTWTQGGGVVPTPADPEIGEVRDPFVFRYDGHRYVVQGAGRPAADGRPQLLLYAADDLTSWTPLGALLTADDPIAAEVAEANIWECPNLVELAGRWVLVISLWRADADGNGVLSGVRYLVGDLERVGAGLRFVPTSGGTLDDGPAFYAPQVLVEPDRTLLWGWSWELDRSPAQLEAAGFAGVLTFPRELTLVDDELACRPAAELTGLRAEPLDPTQPLATGAFELRADSPVGLTLHVDGADVLVVDPTFFAGGPARILVDGSLVEAYGATRTFTTRAYPTTDSRWSATGATEAYRLSL